jgi:hypothetical protein
MSSSLFGDRFVGYRVPAWHAKGIVVDKELTAAEAYAQMGPYTVRRERLHLPDGTPTTRFAIMRDRTVFGYVSNEYVLITPDDLIAMYDECVQRPIETMAALYKGEALFLTTKLPDYDIHGDEVANYLGLVNWMDGAGALTGMITPVRVVCANTLISGLRQATDVMRIVHIGNPLKDLADWASGVYTRALRNSQVLKEAFDILARRRVHDPKPVIEGVYPYKNGEGTAKVNMTRHRVLELFHGAASGADSRAFAGTAWGLYNSFVEYEDVYRRSLKRAEGVLFGVAAQNKRRAFKMVMEM